MPSIEENLHYWDERYRWQARGDEWSTAWGNSGFLWQGTILPRIHRFLPAECVLEIAPGYGRMTEFLRRFAGRLLAVDISPKCLEICRKRFADDPRISFHQNDGRDLSFIADQTVDFAFSWDSLVHCELDVMQAYLQQLSTKLKPDGVAFLHHSNFLDRATHLPPEKQNSDNPHNRGVSVSAELVREFCTTIGLSCFAQEIVNWGSSQLLFDCLTLLTPTGSRFDRPLRSIRNLNFMNEAKRIRILYELYGDRGRGLAIVPDGSGRPSVNAADMSPSGD